MAGKIITDLVVLLNCDEDTNYLDNGLSDTIIHPHRFDIADYRDNDIIARTDSDMFVFGLIKAGTASDDKTKKRSNASTQPPSKVHSKRNYVL
jgi:hypothetical protein